jgi:hypothetical protein
VCRAIGNLGDGRRWQDATVTGSKAWQDRIEYPDRLARLGVTWD